ncbi:VCBS repeat-containing protein [Fulvivirgaceae bacterium PWU4]|uniref:VCBS repeat-containing protein n=1 Tax=Chryseosolibacter histidini TaxID=2782349 RepID=A0AAP2DV51_9BACT|nr:FG-GAP-like repeat-containing protein [Chryseosolibacter histidini]MBT1701279.1 VCBS repeat-containing protein [Chryseosolibacter histidini]
MKIRLLILITLLSIEYIQAQNPVVWQKKNGPTGGQIVDIEVDVANNKIYAIAGRNKPYVSSDNGVTWSRVIFSGADNYFYDIEITNNTIFLVSSYDLYASTNGGTSFSRRSSTDFNSQYSSGYKLKRLSGGRLVVLGSNSIYVSDDNGINWVQGYNYVSAVSRDYLVVNATDQIFIVQNNRPYRSVDGGATFSDFSGGVIPAGTAQSLSATNNGSAVFCVATGGIYTSVGGGAWTSIKGGSISEATISGGVPSFLEFTADGLGMYFMDNFNHRLHAKTVSGASTTWAQQQSPFPSATAFVNCASAKDFPSPSTSTAFFGTMEGIYRTTSGGASITASNSGIGGVEASNIAVDNFNNIFMSAGWVGLLKSTDGNTWNKVANLANYVEDVFTNPPGDVLYARTTPNGGGTNTFSRSLDKGVNWTALTPPTTFIWMGSAGDNDKLFGLSNNYNPATFYYSANQGTTWSAGPVTIGGLPASFYIDEDDVYFASPTLMFLKLRNPSNSSTEELWKISITYSGTAFSSATATKITSPITEQIDKIYAGNGKLYIYSNDSVDKIAVSSDGGTSWNVYTVPDSRTMTVAKNGYIFIMNYSQKVYISKDYGASIIDTDLSTAFANDVTDAEIDNAGRAYLSFNGNFVHATASTIVLAAAPSALTSVGVGATSVALKWKDNSNNEDRFRIEVSANGTTFAEVGELQQYNVCNNTFGYFVVQGLQPSTSYTFRVTAVNAAGASAPVTLVQATASACPQTIPDNRSWSAVNAGTVYAPVGSPKIVSIRNISGSRYSISDLSLGLLGSLSTVPASFNVNCAQTFVVNGDNELQPNGDGAWNGTNQITLKWYDCGGTAEQTITLTLQATDPAPAIPTNLQAYALSNSTIEVSWTAGDYDKKYYIERSLNNVSFSQVGTVNYPTTRFVDNGPLTEGVTYYYRVKSENANASPLQSVFSASKSVVFKKPTFIVTATTLSSYITASIGAYWADFNNDGLEDFASVVLDPILQRGTPVIFKNLGTGNFEKIDPAGIENRAYFFLYTVDYDNDNKTDMIFTGDENSEVFVYKGNGDFTFTKVADADLGALANIPVHLEVSGVSWADINNDGLLDVLYATYDPQESGSAARSMTLLKQTASHSFVKVASPGDVASDTEPAITGVWADYNNDGYQDVLIANSDGDLRLYKNNGNETFTRTSGIGFDGSDAIAVSWGDYNNDGNPDIFTSTSSTSPPLVNALYKNNGDGTFTKELASGLSENTAAIAASWGDYNNDGYLDLVCTGFGSVPTRLLLRDASTAPGNVSFIKLVNEKVNDITVSHYGAANADFNQNGLLDLAMSSFTFSQSDDLGVVQHSLFEANAPTGNWSEVKLVPVNGNKKAIGAKIILTAGGVTQSREISTSSAIVSKNSGVVHFGLGSTSSITNIQVKWRNGAVQNYPNPGINQVLTITEDLQAPSITARVPAHSATGVATNTTIDVTFDDANTVAVAGKKLIVSVSGGSAVANIDAAAATKTGSTFRFTLPAALQGNTDYVVTIESGAFRDIYANNFAGVSAGTWNFKTVDPPDATAPVITFTPAATLPKGFSAASPSITVTDNKQVSTVVVSIRPISGTTYATVNATAGATANTWNATLTEATHFDAIGSEFFITATDAAGNSTRSPEGTATHKVFLTYNENESKIPSDRLGFGGQKANWKVFAIPFELGNNNAVTSIFNEFESLTNKVDYRLITYGSETAWSEYPTGFTTIARGTGYFINIKEPVEIKIGNNLTAPTNSRSSLFSISLKQGWNMVGNPYLTSISWADVAAYNSLTGTTAQLKKFANGAYSNNQSLSSYEGGFVFASAATTVSIPFLGQTTAGGREGFRDLDTNIDAEAWALPIALSQGELSYDLGAVGMSPDASVSFDQHDDVTPPRFFDYLEMNFSHPEHFAKRFTRDVVPTQNAYTWAFTVDANQHGQARLMWDNMALANAQNDIFLLDITLQKLVNMKETGSYFFDPKESTNFRIYFGGNLKIAPESVFLGKAYPNPTSGLTTVAFSLPESGGLNQQVSLDIIDAMGKAAGTISQGSYGPGYHEVSWDAKTLSSGFYTYRLTVNGKHGKTTQVTKLIIK